MRLPLTTLPYLALAAVLVIAGASGMPAYAGQHGGPPNAVQQLLRNKKHNPGKRPNHKSVSKRGGGFKQPVPKRPKLTGALPNPVVSPRSPSGRKNPVLAYNKIRDQCNTLISEGRLGTASERAQALSRLAPSSAEPYVLLAQVHLLQKDYQGAAQFAGEAQARVTNGGSQAELSAVTQQIAQHAAFVQQVAAGDQAVAAGNQAEAAKQYDGAYQIDGSQGSIGLKSASAYLATHDFVSAQRLAQQVQQSSDGADRPAATQLLSQIAATTGAISNLNDQIAAKQSQISALQQQMSSAQQDLESKQQALAQRQKDLDSINSSISSQNDQLNTQAQNETNDIAQVSGWQTNYQNDLNAAQGYANAASQDNAYYQAFFLQKNFGAATAALILLNTANQNASNANAQAQIAVQNVQNWQNSANVAHQQQDQLRQAIQGMQSNMQSAQHDIDGMNSDITNLQAKISQISTDTNSANNDLQALKQSLANTSDGSGQPGP